MNCYVGHVVYERIKSYLEITNETSSLSFSQIFNSFDVPESIEFWSNLVVDGNKKSNYLDEAMIVERVFKMFQCCRFIDVKVLKCLFEIEGDKENGE